MNEISLIEKIKKVPPAYQQEIADFVDFLIEKKIKEPSKKPDRSALLGIFKGKIKVLDNFDDPIEGLEDYM